MKFFRKKEVSDQVQVIDAPENPVIKVSDLKEHMVSLFEYREQQENEIDYLKNRVEDGEKNLQMYKASLVTLDEYKKIIDRHVTKVTDLTEKIEHLKKELSEKNDYINTYKVKENMMRDYKQQVHKEIRQELLKNIISNIKLIKGNLSKRHVIEVINDFLE